MLAYLQTGWNYLRNILRSKHRLGWRSFVVLGVIALAVVLVTSPVAHAEPGWTDSVVQFIANIILWVATLFLKLAIFCLTFIIEVAGYNKYLDSTAVNYGWVMVRDLTNMIFVVILLLIAFGTILGIEQYEWKKMLVKFVAAAILVNFSRIICGVMIDLGQVVMITFINGVAATAGGNLINAFGANEIMSLAEGGVDSANLNSGEVFMASVMAVVFSGMMLMTMLVYLVILVARMIQLWVLIVLSPFAFVFSVIPTTQKYASEWWQKFGSNVVSGPIVAFFLWLSFVTLGQGNAGAEVADGSAVKNTVGDGSDPSQSAGITKAMSWAKMANFAIAIGMLLVGAETAQKLGVTGGSMMSKVGDFGKKVATIGSGVALGRWIGGKAAQGGKFVGKHASHGALGLVVKPAEQIGAKMKNWSLIKKTKWNENWGSKLGAWAQFGAHEKIMKERKAQAEQLTGNLSSSAKGKQNKLFAGRDANGEWTKIEKFDKEGNKMLLGIEAVRAYTDEIQGKGKIKKAASEATRQTRIAKAGEAVLKDAKGGKDYAAKMSAATAAEMNLGTAKTQVEIDFLNSIPKNAKEGWVNPLIESRANSDALTKAKQAQMQTMISSFRSERVKKALNEVGEMESGRREALEKLDEKSKGIAEEEAALGVKKTLDDVIAKIGSADEKTLGGVLESLPKDIQETLTSPAFKMNEGEKYKDAYLRKLNEMKGEVTGVSPDVTEASIAKKKEELAKEKAEIMHAAEHDEHEFKMKAANNPEIAEVFYNIMQKENDLMLKRRSALLESSVNQGAIGNARGISYPKSAFNASINEMQHHFEGMERPQMLSAMEAAMNRMVKKRQENPEGYEKSSEYDMDQLFADALLAKLQKERFVDDMQGRAEQIAHKKELERITSIGGDLGARTVAHATRITEAQSNSHSSTTSGGNQIDLSSVLRDVSHSNYGNLKSALSELAGTLKVDLKGLKSVLQSAGGLGDATAALDRIDMKQPHWEKFDRDQTIKLLTKLAAGQVSEVHALEEMSNK